MKTKTVALGRNLVFCTSIRTLFERERMDLDESSILYVGSIDDLSALYASEVALIHPECIKYYQLATATLWKERGNPRGTEDAVRSVRSYLPHWTKSVLIYYPFV